MAPPRLTERACAKVNLCLHITGQREDGYHLLDSVVVFAGICDVLHASVAPVSSLTLEGPFGADVPADMDNLVLRAARACDPDFPVAFTLEKHLPPASGIGGGSADAAAALRAMARFHAADEDRPVEASAFGRDRQAVLDLGADVAVCMMSMPARMRGIGERLDVLGNMPGGGILLVNPGVEVPTPAVFRALRNKENPPLPDTLPEWRDMAELAVWLHGTRNDLEQPALDIAPVIADVLAALRPLPGALFSRMSGSGATCFALFADQAAAERAAIVLRAKRPEWWISAGPVHAGHPKAANWFQEILLTT